MIPTEYTFGSHTIESGMRSMVSLAALNWFTTNSTYARLMKQQLLLPICWYFNVGACRRKVVCNVLSVDSIGTENIKAYVSNFPEI